MFYSIIGWMLARSTVTMPRSVHSAAYQEFLALLREVRIEADISQEELGRRMDWPQTVVSKCERGERRVDVVELWRWCREVGITLPEFIKRLDRELKHYK